MQRKGSKAKRAARKAKKEALNGAKPFSVNAPVRDAVLSGTLTEAQVTEGYYISVLLVLFVLILIEGVAIAASVRPLAPLPHCL